MYDPRIVQPMRQDLTSAGFQELLTPEDVDTVFKGQSGTLLCVVNSVCGCSAGGARPGVKLALNGAKRPNKLTTVFAGQDREATERARTYFAGYPPSSPAIALLKDGQVAFMLERQDIEGFSADQIAAKLKTAFEELC